MDGWCRFSESSTATRQDAAGFRRTYRRACVLAAIVGLLVVLSLAATPTLITHEASDERCEHDGYVPIAVDL